MSSDTEDTLLDRINKVLPLVQWTLGIVVAIAVWAFTLQFTVNGHGDKMKDYENGLKEHSTAIRSLELNEAAILNTLKGIDKKLDQIDSKLDGR